MKKIIFTAICLLLSTGNVFGQIQEEPKYKLNPSVDKESPAGIYIPKDLEDCFKELRTMLAPALIEEMKSGTESDMNKYHRSLGMWLRNNWGLWSDSRLKKYFNDIGIHHPDDMSGIILTSFWRHLNNKPIQLQDQISYYRQYWKDMETDKEKNHKAETPTQESRVTQEGQ
ncbi:MAG: DUF6794 domain-containing protein [Candidatus Omnitrophota bacterium]